MNKVKYTVVIPHYESLTYLQRGLNSIPIRNDIQIIVVDDASTEENNAIRALAGMSYHQTLNDVLTVKNNYNQSSLDN